MSFPPRAFIIGAQRSATTSLSFLLQQHPMIALSEPKEPHFFGLHWEKGLDWYRSCFPVSGEILMDASVSYTMAPVTGGGVPSPIPERLYAVSPDAKLIYIVRDPADRCYSAYWHEVRSGRERRSLREAVADGAYYILASYYYLQFKPFLSFFPRENMFVGTFDEFQNDPAALARKCATFLSVDAGSFGFVLDEPRNRAFQYNRLGVLLRDRLGENKLKSLFRTAGKWMPRTAYPAVRSMIHKSVPPITESERRWLTERFRDDATAFAELTGVDAMRES